MHRPAVAGTPEHCTLVWLMSPPPPPRAPTLLCESPACLALLLMSCPMFFVLACDRPALRYISLPPRAPPQPRTEPQACFFFRLRKVLDLGCNAVLAYQQDFDVEGDSGIVARAYGTACVIQRREPERTDHPLVRQVCLFGQQRLQLGPAWTNK